MQALIGIALAACDPTRKSSTSAPVDPSDEAAAENEERRKEEEAEWADIEAEAGDGGKGLSISDLEFDLNMGKSRQTRERPTKGKSAPKYAPSASPLHPHGPPKPKKPESPHQHSGPAKNNEPNGNVAALSQQMQKRMVIMDDEEYGMQ